MRYTFSGFDLDTDAYKLSQGGKELRLQPQVFDVLRYLVEHRERVVSKEELLDALWRDAHVNETAVTWSISHARRALGQGRGHKAPIETVHGRGYRFVADVSTSEGTAERVSEPPTLDAARSGNVKLPFVGRSELMGLLQHQLIEVQGGSGKLALLHGEAGIGKTRCVTELGALARTRGFLVLSGRSIEGVGAPVFWPWQQVLRTLIQERPELRAPASALLAQLSAADVDPEPSESAAPASGSRVRLFDEVLQLMLAASRSSPTLLLFDDLHWADAGTIELIAFAAPEIAVAKLMVVGTQREEPTPHNSRALSRLVRRAQNLVIGDLTPGDIAKYIADYTQQGEPSPELSAAVFAATAGNPLFVQETVRSLVAERGATALRTLSPVAVQPSRLARDVLRGPLRALDPQTLALLSLASVLGETFELTLLKQIADLDIDTLLDRLDAALQRGFLVAEAPNRYRFQYSLVRTILYDDVKPTERVAAHRRAAQLLSQFPDREQRASEIAIHYYKSLAAEDAAAVTEATKRAARAAERVHAFDDAATFLQWALEAQALDRSSTTRDRALLLTRCGRAQRLAGREEDSRRTLETAIELASKYDYGDVLVKIARILRPTHAMSLYPDELLRAAMEQVLQTSPEGPNPQRISALSQLACLPPIAFDLEASKRTSGLALSLARERIQQLKSAATKPRLNGRDELEDPDGRSSLVEALRARLFSLSGPDDIAATLALCDEILELDQPVSDVSWDAHMARYGALLYRGDLRAAGVALEAVGHIGNELHLSEARWYYERQRAQRLIARGRFDEADQAIKALRAKSTRLGLGYGALFTNVMRAALDGARGGAASLAIDVDLSGATWPSELNMSVRSYATRVAAEAGALDDARRNLLAVSRRNFSDVPKEISYLLNLSNYAMAAFILEDRAAADTLYGLLSPYPEFNTPDLLLIEQGSVSRFLALLAITTGQTDKIEQHYQVAIDMNQRIEHVPQLTCCYYEYARWLRSQPGASDQQKSRAIAQQAMQLSQRIGMTWLHEQARTLA